MINTLDIKVTPIATSKIAELEGKELVFGRYFSDHMFSMDYKDGEWRNLEILPYQPLTLNPSCLVFHYGQAIFEGMKAYKNKAGDVALFRPDANIKRFNKSAARMCMPDVPDEIFLEALKQLIRLDIDWVPEADGFSSLYIRPFMIATDEYVGVKASTTYKFLIITSPAGLYYKQPVKVKVEKSYTRSAEGGTGFAKAAGNYAASMLPSKLALEEGFQQLIWTDAIEHKYIEESGTMNVLFMINGTLITPPASNTILRGVTRDSVLDVARSWGIPVEERRISIDEVIEAINNNTLTEVFGAGTAATIAHIASIYHDGKDYILPTVENRDFSNKVAKYLYELRSGAVEDTFGWMVKC